MFQIMLLAVTLILSCGVNKDQTYSGPKAGGVSEKQTWVCSSDKDCEKGKGCIKEIGCMPFAQEGIRVSVVVEPPSVLGLIGDQFYGVPIGSSGTIDLTLTKPVVITGVVYHGELGTESSKMVNKSELVSAHLVAVAKGKIPGTQLLSEADSDPSKNEKFTLKVTPGIEYDITVLPYNQADSKEFDIIGNPKPLSLPPFRFSHKFTSSGEYNIILPPKEQLFPLQGVVLLDETKPIQNAVVTCFSGDDQTGNSSITDESGGFILLLPPNPSQIRCKVSGGKGCKIMFPVTEFVVEGPSVKGLFQKFVVGPLPAERKVTIQVLGSPEMVAVPLAKIMVWGKAGKGEMSTSGITDSDGVLSINILEGIYQLTVISPQNSEYAVTQRVLDLSSNQTTDTFQVILDKRIHISVDVVYAENYSPVSNALVSFMSNTYKNMDSGAIPLPEITFDTVTDEKGHAELWIDEGRYALTVAPQSSLPRFSQPDLLLEGGSKHIIIPIPAGRLVRGRVVSFKDSLTEVFPVANAQVRFYYYVHDKPEIKDELWSINQTSFAGNVQFIGGGETDQDGRYEIILPEFKQAEYSQENEGMDKDSSTIPTPFGYSGAKVEPQ